MLPSFLRVVPPAVHTHLSSYINPAMAALIATPLLLALASGHQTLLPRQEIDWLNTTSDAKFDGFIARANASTTRLIELPNIHTSKYPSKEDQNTDWKAWLWTTEQLARGGAMFGGLHPDDKYISANGSVQVDDSWLACMRLTRFRNPGLPLDQTIQSDCSNVFPADCLQYLHEFAQEGRMCHNLNSLNLGRTREKWNEGPCSGALNGEHDPMVLEPDKVFRVNHLDDLQTASTSVYGENRKPDTRYDAVVNSVYMLAVGFARASDKQPNRFSNTSIDMDAETVPSKFICMRADKFSQGSRTLEDISNMGVTTRAPLLGLTLVMGACVAALTGEIL
ncbi:hypothetical protein QBC37DRAFT_434744 [Rhypophila decipiens]|uniref:Uncharacterized protein n=1 Tax=Rhypophila decipiens TaxID=261697 RepID=A0AAN7AYX5_9PEZI|nr:hypothetical protein QBC37DRAFT_434744 [Rhypophila decipiens]